LPTQKKWRVLQQFCLSTRPDALVGDTVPVSDVMLVQLAGIICKAHGLGSTPGTEAPQEGE